MKYSGFHQNDKMYGLTKLGARGQVVIPAEARKDLRLKAGDHLVVLGRGGVALGLIKPEQLREMLAIIMEQISGSPHAKGFQKELQKILNKKIK